jgi:succinate dehydrogenase / fumarate reductase, flavoprotein subunit
MSAEGPLEGVRFRLERPEDRETQIVLRFRDGEFHVAERRNRTIDAGARPFFERDWPAWLTGAIYDRASG